MLEYERDSEATHSVFRQGWFKTGDLGFLHNGELYVTGRVKEMIIVRGQNFYAQEIEVLAGRVEGVWLEKTMAISIPTDGTEGLVILTETRIRSVEKRKTIIGAICEIVSKNLGLSPLDVVLVNPGELPRTSSGKLERFKGISIYRNRIQKL